MGNIIGSLLGIKAPKPQPVPVTPESDPAASAAADEAARKQRRAAALASGRASTILTGGQGVTSAAPVAQHTLTGQ